ncbi:OLC1v1004494C2 [Oldenlandia corymbosa var. corymbosa]|uniref:OLC1v1004494C2 n=1 Tax=Oldenlandia corymbosa var. corymbosa TaxID=529605 RepID=A0AAV1DF40_OLDCO|nr:OLC1v1004494C2 [Oldenlandia corymbosa var. corymbosa]
MASSDPSKRPRPGPWPPGPESAAPMPPSSWAKRTGFRPKFSGEANAGDSGPISVQPQPKPREADASVDLESGRARPVPTSNGEVLSPVPERPGQENDKEKPVRKRRDSDGGDGGGGGAAAPPAVKGPRANGKTPPSGEEAGAGPGNRRGSRSDEVVDTLPQSVVDDDDFIARHAHMKYELRDSPGLVPIGLYGFQHYLSMLGSLILIPLVIVPAMGGNSEDTANVVSTVLFMSGVTTLLHTAFGSRLPLIQGPSFVYLAPALAIINSSEFLGLNGNNFKHIMKELQGAIIIGSAFQVFLGYSGLMSLFLRLINPVVVSPTIAAVGLSFYSYGFPRVGACVEIGAVQILLVVIFSLYLRKVSVLGHRIFLIYAVPLGLAITWVMAILLTKTGAYNHNGCDVNIPTSNIVSEHCRKHVSRMKYCRVDSHALESAPWFRFPYPLQWGTPVFHWKMALVMCVVSIISSVDSVGSYHAASLLVASRPPTPGVLSRGIGLEGITSLLAGLWGTGTGSTTLTENVHTIAVTKMGSRKAVQLGAGVLIFLSLIGKVGGFLASIPEVMVAGLLCFMWAMLTALGLSNLRYSEAGSSRNIIIVGLSLFLSLSIPSYFQQYGVSPNTNLAVASYYQPYIVASHGPIRTKNGGLNYVLNTLLSLNMLIAFLVAVILDNTVPGSQQERGVYVWSDPDTARREPAVTKDYELPFRVGRVFRWVKWVGL